MARNTRKRDIPLAFTITVARTVSQLSFLTAVHTAKEIAKHAGISEVFVCTASTPGPNPTPSGMFTYVPAHDELSSNVVGLDVYNKDKQNIGTIKDIALDASGLKGYIVDVGGFLGMGEHLCCRAPVGNQLQCQGRQMACHNERKR
jgi:PRC-barrel domain